MHCVDLGQSFQTHIFLQNLASIQPRTSPVKFARSTMQPPHGGVDADTEVLYTVKKAGQDPPRELLELVSALELLCPARFLSLRPCFASRFWASRTRIRAVASQRTSALNSRAARATWSLTNDLRSFTRPSVCCSTTNKFEKVRRLALGCSDADFCK